MKLAIIGCGLIGEKRARNLTDDCQLKICVDLNQERAQALASHYPGAIAIQNWQQAVDDPEIDIIIVATLHADLSQIGLAAVKKGKHVLLEKPGGRRVNELAELIAASSKSGSLVHVGFNHRFHRAFRKAKELVEEGALGELMFVRGRYGHGGRVGYDKEWRANPELSGGGELIDQGVHLIDLARWFLGDFSEVQGFANTYYWDMPVDDNGFLMLKTAKKQMAFLHASCTEWKNLFSFEVYGRNGKLEINGLGGSYGVERIAFYKMSPAMGPPETTVWEYPMADDSWEKEFSAFIDDIRNNRLPSPGLHDAEQALKVVEEVYRSCNYDYCT